MLQQINWCLHLCILWRVFFRAPGGSSGRLRSGEKVEVNIADSVTLTGHTGSITADHYQSGNAQTVVVGTFKQGNNVLLVPGLSAPNGNSNQYDVKWTNSTADWKDWKLEISKGGSYKLMNDTSITDSGIQITATDNVVTLDGNNKQIASKDAEKAPMLISTSKDVTLKNVNLTATSLKNSTLIQAVTVSGTTVTSPAKFTVENSKLSATLDSAASGADNSLLGTGANQFYSILARPSSDLIVKNTEITITGKNSDDHAYPIKFKAQNDSALNVTITGSILSVSNTVKASGGIYAVTEETAGSIGKLFATISDNKLTVTTGTSGIAKLLYYTPVVNNSKFDITKNTITLSGKDNYVMDVMLSGAVTRDHAVNFQMSENTVTLGSSAPSEKTFHVIKFAQRALADGADRTAYLNGKIARSNTFTGNNGYLFLEQGNLQAGKTLINVDTSGLTIEGQTIDLKIIAPYDTGIDLGNTTQKDGTAKKFTVTPEGTSVSWSSSNTSVLTIQADGNYTAKAVGTTTITATDPNNAKAEMLITIYQTAVPALPVSEVTKDTEGKATISNSSEVAIQDKVATIEDSNSGVVMTVTFADTPDTSSPGTIKGTVTKANVTFKEAPAASPEMETSYSIVINLANVTNYLPTIDPVFNVSVVDTIENKFSESSKYTFLSMITATGDNVTKINNNVSKSEGIKVTFKISKDDIRKLLGDSESAVSKIKAFHVSGDTVSVPLTGSGKWVDNNNFYEFTVTGDGFCSYVLAAFTYTAPPSPVNPPVSSGSGDGNMDGAYRVLFNDGSSTLSVKTGLSAGDKLTAPTKDGYTFGGRYKDSACTQAWSFSESIPGDMTLYAKWTASSGSQTTTPTATAQQTVKATPAATQAQNGASATTAAAPSGTAASGSTSPAMTQAPAPVLGALLGLLAAGVLLR